MRHRSLSLLIPAVALGSLLAAPTKAADPNCKQAITAVGPFYIDDRGGFTSGGGGVWLYMESNGKANLQAGGKSVLPAPVGEADPCFPKEKTPDTLIF